MIEETAKYIGAGRALFSTDGSISAGIEKIIGADIPMQDKITILNNPAFERYLERGM